MKVICDDLEMSDIDEGDLGGFGAVRYLGMGSVRI